ncbi:ydjO [Escherichia coli]|nr:ydjO [Escherichia coli]
MMSLWDALRMNMMISYQELVRTFLNKKEKAYSLHYHFLRLSKIAHFLMSLFV